jgi:endonuclease YncB( thermonuclease family)
LGAAFAQEAQLRSPVGQLYGPVPLLRVVDGDTLVVQSNVGPRTVRLTGIDAPELSGDQPGARAAAANLESLLSGVTLLWLELDLEPDDAYGRLLAYVDVPDTNGAWDVAGVRAAQVNLQMLVQGWAQPLAVAPNVTYADLYAAAWRQARSQQLGQWAPAPPTTTQQAVTQAGAEAPVRLHCALVNPSTPNDTGEWVSVLVTQPHDTRGYYVFDQGSRAVFRLPSGVQQPGQIRVTNPGQGVWNNSGDVIYLMRGGEVVDSWAYRREDAVEGRIICRDQHQDAR